jgi:transposase
VVGIDIAQQVHVARSVNFRGIVLGKPISFGNHEEGFTLLLHWIKKLLDDNHLNKRDVVVKRLVTTKNQLHRWVEIV